MNVFYFSKLKPQFIECILSFQEETKLLLIRQYHLSYSYLSSLFILVAFRNDCPVWDRD